MKTLFLLILIIFWVYLANAQNVNIPDANFKNVLIEAGVDTDENGEISYAEAEAVISLNVSEQSISDMTGISAFINLNTLACNDNQLTSLDVSNNISLVQLVCGRNSLTYLDVSNCTALIKLDVSAYYGHYNWSGGTINTLDISDNIELEELNCSGNPLMNLNVSNNTALISLYCVNIQITSLDVSNNTELLELFCYSNKLDSLDVSSCTALEQLWCGPNQLASLDVSNNIALKILYCGNNPLTSLDVSNNTALTELHCWNNQLTSLDLSNNTVLTKLILEDMPNLTEVCVWEMPFPPAGVNVDIYDCPNVDFTTTCSITGLNTYRENNWINIYPNPVTDKLTIELGENINSKTSITMYEITGKVVYSENLESTPLNHTINLSSLRKGLYLITISNEHYSYTEKVIKVE